jgi:signal peptidase I
MRTRQTKKLLAGAAGLIALACLWFYFAPVGLGGRTTYVDTDGISMEPHFHAGDLVLVRRQSSYHVGEIVAYRSNVFHTIVLHRIVARDGAAYVFRGDNNNFVDFEHPAAGQLIGALWLHIPGAGARLAELRSPALVGLLVGAGALLLGGAAFARRKRRRGRHRRGQEPPAATPRRGAPRPAEPVVNALAVGLLVLLPFVALGVLGFTRPSTALVPSATPYEQSGALAYSAEAAPGPAYPSGRAETGEPLFTHVVSLVSVRFEYRFRSAAPHSLAGTASLSAAIASTNGWQTTLPLGRAAHFTGNRALVTGNLDLASVLALLRHLEATTAVGGSFTLTLVPTVRTTGRLDGLPLHVTFAPRIPFSLNPLEVQPVSSAGSPLAAGPSPTSPFRPSLAGSVTGRRYQPLVISLAIVRVPVAAARRIALGGIAVVVCVLLAVCLQLRSRPRDESADIIRRYRRMIIPVARVRQRPGDSVIDVESMEALARIAEHYDRSILHEAGDLGDAFWVSDESGQFRYSPRAARAPAGGVPVEVRPDGGGLGDGYAGAPEFAGPISAYGTQPTPADSTADESGWEQYAAGMPAETIAHESQEARAAHEAAAAVYADELKLAATAQGIG